MKYISNYANNAAYLAAKGNAASFFRPHVSLVKDSMAVMYDDILARIGDYLFSDMTYGSTLIAGKTPIAVCVAPASHFLDGKARWMSLVNMSAMNPESGTTATGNDSSTNDGAGFCWGYNSLLIGDEMPAVPYYAESEGEIGDTLLGAEGNAYCGIEHYSEGYEEDNYWTHLYGDVYVENDDYHNPCILTEAGERDPRLSIATVTYDEQTYNNPLADFAGASKTAAIIAEATLYTTGAITRNDYSEGSYPAAMACHRFYTAGTAAGDWYLPAMGELAYVAARLDSINAKLDAAGNAAVKVGDYDSADTLGYWLWSSSEGSGSSAWSLYTYGGTVTYGVKCGGDGYYRVRAFLAY